MNFKKLDKSMIVIDDNGDVIHEYIYGLTPLAELHTLFVFEFFNRVVNNQTRPYKRCVM